MSLLSNSASSKSTSAAMHTPWELVISGLPVTDTVCTSMPALRATSTTARHSTSSEPSAMKTLILLI